LSPLIEHLKKYRVSHNRIDDDDDDVMMFFSRTKKEARNKRSAYFITRPA
jgi:hypothetical protein